MCQKYKRTYVSRVEFQIFYFNRIWTSTTLIEVSHTKFHDNPFNGSSDDIRTEKWTDWRYRALSTNYGKELTLNFSPVGIKRQERECHNSI